MARANTGDPLWDAAQKSLLIHGELHNNLRMTWGKAILQWTRSPEEALQMMIDLNHRYALDGSDPNSYGGILWCLGLFDRPFQPEQPVIGTLRPRSTRSHAARLDLRKYTAAFFSAVGSLPEEPVFAAAHRWRYAKAQNPLDDGCLWDRQAMIGLCGDWCCNSRIEGAFLSGAAMAGRVLGAVDKRQ